MMYYECKNIKLKFTEAEIAVMLATQELLNTLSNHINCDELELMNTETGELIKVRELNRAAGILSGLIAGEEWQELES